MEFSWLPIARKQVRQRLMFIILWQHYHYYYNGTTHNTSYLHYRFRFDLLSGDYDNRNAPSTGTDSTICEGDLPCDIFDTYRITVLRMATAA